MATASEYVESIRFKETPINEASEINKQEALKMVRFNLFKLLLYQTVVRRF
jgi:hypothetical protein